MISATAWRAFKTANTVSVAGGYGPIDFMALSKALAKDPFIRLPVGAGKKLASELYKLSEKEVAEVTAFFS